MYRHSASGRHTKTPAVVTETFAQYLILPSEPEEVIGAANVSFGFRNRYMTKRRVMRIIRRIRRTQV